MFDQYQAGRKPASGGQSSGPQQIWSPDFASGLKIVPTNCTQGIWVDGTTTFTPQTGVGFYNLFDGTANDGHVLCSAFPFYALNWVLSVAASPTTVVYEYWNGSAWTAFVPTASATWSTLGYTQARWTIALTPGWVPGGTGTGIPAGMYCIRVRQTAGTTVVTGRASIAHALDVSLTEALVSDINPLSTWKAYNRNFPSTLTCNANQIGGVNGIASALGASTWYYLYLISNGYQWGLWLDTSTTPTLPGDFRFKTLLGAYRTDANSVLLPWYQFGNEVTYPLAITDLNGGVATTWTSVPITAPSVAVAYKSVLYAQGGAVLNVGPEPGVAHAEVYIGLASATPQIGGFWVPFKIAQTTYYNVNVSSGSINTLGYRMPGNLS